MATKTISKKAVRRRKKAKEEINPANSPEPGDEIVTTNRGEVEEVAKEEANKRQGDFPTDLKEMDYKYPGHEFVKDWPGRDVFIAFPCHKQTNAATTWALVATAQDLGKQAGQLDMSLGDGMIYNARNRLANRFLETEAEWLVWVDDDMIPPIGRPEWYRWIGGNKVKDMIAGQHYIPRLKAHNKTLVGGCYFGRQLSGIPVFNSGRVNSDAFSAAKRASGQLLATEWTGTGCMLVHRSVLEDIKTKFPDLAPSDRYPWWNFFHPMQGYGEDVSFCLRAKEAGHISYTDTGLQCLHVGYCAWGFHNTEGKFGESPNANM